MATAEILRHWDRVAELGCVCCGRPAEIAHAHGGSLLGLGIYRAKGKKPSDWLTLPICPEHHRVEHKGLDYSPRLWEERWGTQVRYLNWVSDRVGYDVFERAGVKRDGS
jgi:hypothetical protein